MSPAPKKAYIVAVDMGYGHQRAAFPLIDIATTPKEWGIEAPMIISANNYPNIAKVDKDRWDSTQRRYEKISRMNSIPFFGSLIFKVMDYFQQIEAFYPRRDLSAPTLQGKRTYDAIKKGFGKDLIDVLNKDPLPLICTFFIPAIVAEGHGYKGEIYCLCTDSDISRAWAPVNSKVSKIIYLAPTIRVKERLQRYGVRAEKIIVTGFPLPENIIGNGNQKNSQSDDQNNSQNNSQDNSQSILTASLSKRILNLDPTGIFQKKYQPLISSYLDLESQISNKRPLTITFAVGGAGAQWKIALVILNSLKEKIVNKEIKLNLIAGVSKKIKENFEVEIKRLNMQDCLQDSLEIIYDENKFDYFEKFDQTLVDTDILWTKPSELSFYAGLGMPIIMAPTLGSQEKLNREWLQFLGAGFDQKDPAFVDEWLFDLLRSGCLAQAALNGFLKVPQNSAEWIKNAVLNSKMEDNKSLFL